MQHETTWASQTSQNHNNLIPWYLEGDYRTNIYMCVTQKMLAFMNSLSSFLEERKSIWCHEIWRSADFEWREQSLSVSKKQNGAISWKTSRAVDECIHLTVKVNAYCTCTIPHNRKKNMAKCWWEWFQGCCHDMFSLEEGFFIRPDIQMVGIIHFVVDSGVPNRLAFLLCQVNWCGNWIGSIYRGVL